MTIRKIIVETDDSCVIIEASKEKEKETKEMKCVKSNTNNIRGLQGKPNYRRIVKPKKVAADYTLTKVGRSVAFVDEDQNFYSADRTRMTKFRNNILRRTDRSTVIDTYRLTPMDIRALLNFLREDANINCHVCTGSDRQFINEHVRILAKGVTNDVKAGK